MNCPKQFSLILVKRFFFLCSAQLGVLFYSFCALLFYFLFCSIYSCRIIGNEAITRHFEIDKRSGQLTISKSTALDVNHLKSENVFFAVEVSLSIFFICVVLCSRLNFHSFVHYFN